MQVIELAVVLLVAAAGLRVLAGRLDVPHPVLLVLGGLALAAIPGLPRIAFEPETLFILFVPPLLYLTAFFTSLRDFRAKLGAISRYGTLLVLLTIVAVAWAAHTLLPELTWPAAFVLGAIVSPPDPVAAVAILRRLGAPRDVVILLEGEGLVNDAAALVAYRIGVAAVVTGTFSPGQAAIQFLVTGVGGVIVGLAVGWLIGEVRRRTTFPIVENTISLLSPFLAYLPADRLGLSGVLATVAAGLYLGRRGPRFTRAASRVQAEGTWTMVQFLLESFIFMLVGLELPYVLHGLGSHSLAQLIGYGAVVTLVAIAVRLLYTFVSVLVLRSLRRRRQVTAEPSWRFAAFIGWTGMRGGDSLVIALALPLATAAGAPFPARDLIIFLTFAVIFDTLVLQGLTLKPLLRWLRLGDTGELYNEEAHARRVAAEAALRRLDLESEGGAGVDPAVVRILWRKYEARVARWSARDRDVHGAEDPEHLALADRDGTEAERQARGQRQLSRAIIGAERLALIELRDSGAIGDEVLRRVQRDLDLETMLLEAGEDDAPASPYDTG
jgi:CPA1 family monovalent cation:H+ antiporter